MGFSFKKYIMDLIEKEKRKFAKPVKGRDTQVFPKQLPTFFGRPGFDFKQYDGSGFVTRPDRGGDISPEMDRIENSKNEVFPKKNPLLSRINRYHQTRGRNKLT